MKDMNNLKIGDQVWWATCGNEQVNILCPVCFDKKYVIVILGNDEHIQTPCEMCRKGCSEPYGYITEYKWAAKCEEVCIERISFEEDFNGKSDIKYRIAPGYCVYPKDLFGTKEEAENRCQEQIKEHEAEEKKKLEWSKEKANNSYSWHVGYHTKEANRAKKDFEYHSQRAINCKMRAKTEKEKNKIKELDIQNEI